MSLPANKYYAFTNFLEYLEKRGKEFFDAKKAVFLAWAAPVISFFAMARDLVKSFGLELKSLLIDIVPVEHGDMSFFEYAEFYFPMNDMFNYIYIMLMTWVVVLGYRFIKSWIPGVN